MPAEGLKVSAGSSGEGVGDIETNDCSTCFWDAAKRRLTRFSVCECKDVGGMLAGGLEFILH